MFKSDAGGGGCGVGVGYLQRLPLQKGTPDQNKCLRQNLVSHS